MEELKELIESRLNILNPNTEYSYDIDGYILRAENMLKLELGYDLPEGIEFLLAEIVTGLIITDELLSDEKSNGTIVSVREGNISMSYKGGNSLFETAREMCNITEYKLAPFRRINW